MHSSVPVAIDIRNLDRRHDLARKLGVQINVTSFPIAPKETKTFHFPTTIPIPSKLRSERCRPEVTCRQCIGAKGIAFVQKSEKLHVIAIRKARRGTGPSLTDIHRKTSVQNGDINTILEKESTATLTRAAFEFAIPQRKKAPVSGPQRTAVTSSPTRNERCICERRLKVWALVKRESTAVVVTQLDCRKRRETRIDDNRLENRTCPRITVFERRVRELQKRIDTDSRTTPREPVIWMRGERGRDDSLEK